MEYIYKKKISIENPCKLENDKAIYNDRNKYSQNFKGLYCVCHRPYPDPERSTSEVMIQCIICEDWLHQEHIFQEQDKSSFYAQDFDEFICHGCMKEHPFLMVYKVIPELKEEEEMEEKDVCLFAKRQKLKQADSENIKPTFWNREWREQLCQCSICIAMYEREKVTFLIDLEDSLLAYEEKAREQQRDANIEEAAQKAFQKNLSHEQQVEMAIGYNHMKNSLQQYLTSFATHGKTVRAEDIQHFFQTLKENQKNSTSSSNDAKRQRIGSP
jgi:E3 ubiquitin-protein ligase UBR7